MRQILAASVVAALGFIGGGTEGVEPGKPVAGLSDLNWIHGEPISRFEPGRVYVLEFWSTWCGACAESIDGLNGLALRYQADAVFVAIHIWQRESAPKPAEFLNKRGNASKPVMEFSVADDASGATAAAWMDATENAGLPTVMIVDRASRLVWFGRPKDLEKPLKEVIDGRFDLERGVADMQRHIRVGRLAKEADAAIERGEYPRAARLMLEALDTDPDTVAAWIPSTYGHLLAKSRSPAVAAEFARVILAHDAGKRSELLAGMAHAILHFRPQELRDLDLALTLAERASAASNGNDPAIADLVAKIRAEQMNPRSRDGE